MHLIFLLQWGLHGIFFKDKDKKVKFILHYVSESNTLRNRTIIMSCAILIHASICLLDIMCFLLEIWLMLWNKLQPEKSLISDNRKDRRKCAFRPVYNPSKKTSWTNFKTGKNMLYEIIWTWSNKFVFFCRYLVSFWTHFVCLFVCVHVCVCVWMAIPKYLPTLLAGPRIHQLQRCKILTIKKEGALNKILNYIQW